MNGQQIYLKTINELRVIPHLDNSITYFIPAYQRGYRWSSLQVTQLLEDIRDFSLRKNPQPEEFYCLQPLVVKPRTADEFEVVDGQQRLTTLLLILRHFIERLPENERQPLFTIKYETRPNLHLFLEGPREEDASDNVDYLHLYEAIKAIENWFKQHESEVEMIKAVLLNNTKVIWFELTEQENSVDAFTRLNVGKIPLTNEELIRALFLRSTSQEDKVAQNVRMRIAYEWDQLEKGLQADDFWYFLSNQNPRDQPRIGIIFDLFARTQGVSEEIAQDPYRLFYFFNQRMKEAGITPESEWRKIKKTYLMLEEWFEDRTLFHIIGFLVSQGLAIKDIQALSQNHSKSEFEQDLRQVIFNRVITQNQFDPSDRENIRLEISEYLEALSYGSKDNRCITDILLLFNVATLLQNRRSNMRFQFDSFKREPWDIEHIRSVASDKPDRDYLRANWLKVCLSYLEQQDNGTDLCASIKEFLSLPKPNATDKIFDELYDSVLMYFQEAVDDESVNSIANLTLLDEHTNRSYKNAPFAIKRQRLLELDQHGIFVPLCTRNVFLKCYSPQVANAIFWSKEDQQGYREAIINVLVTFFCGNQDGDL